MKLEINIDVLVELRKKFSENVATEPTESYRWKTEQDVDSDFLQNEEIAELRRIVRLKRFWEDLAGKTNNRINRSLYRKLGQIEKVRAGGDTKIKKLETLAEALQAEARQWHRHWFIDDDGEPYIFTEIRYKPPGREDPPYVRVVGKAWRRGKHVSWGKSLSKESLGKAGLTATEAFSLLRITSLSEDAAKEYDAEIERYFKIVPQTGTVYWGEGIAGEYSDDSYRWSREKVDMSAGGVRTKLVVDDNHHERGKHSRVMADIFVKVAELDEDESTGAVKIPVHPYVVAFDLRQHVFLEVNTTQMEEYEFDKTMAEKLVLPADNKEIIDTLIDTKADTFEDIVRGKSGGIIVLTSGPPGTGKTLTAEVYSEKVEKPLYVVQCSQLGTDPADLEKELGTVLERALRWDAVMLIDEADVYIHERGTNMVQNAVVGVFLRLLEYYSGVLFMTTNRETVTDDAIKSRCIAHVRYRLPAEDERQQLWDILSEQFGAKIDPDLRDKLITEFPHASGRSIKQLCRLAKVLATKRKSKMTVKIFKEVAKFQDVEGNHE